MFYRVDAFSRCFSLLLRLACREFVGKLLICFLQLFVSSNRSLLSLLFQDHKTLHVEEPKRTQHSFPLCLSEDVGCLCRRIECIR